MRMSSVGVAMLQVIEVALLAGGTGKRMYSHNIQVRGPAGQGRATSRPWHPRSASWGGGSCGVGVLSRAMALDVVWQAGVRDAIKAGLTWMERR